MQLRRSEFERIRTVLAESDADEPLTAREIYDLLCDHDVEIDSPHHVATVLGRRAEAGDVRVFDGQPYRYRLR